jgi:CRP-like cAMP-binding protein
VALPVVDVSKQSLSINELLERNGAFGAVVLEGMLLQYLQLGSQPGLTMLGPGEIIALRDAPTSTLLGLSTYRAAADTTLGLFSTELLLAARRAPRLVIGLHIRLAEQLERLGTQLVICQLPRVEDRILAMLWLLAESWGRVTPSGTALPLSLTHEVLGALVGARRPTVTLAVGELAERGALVQQDRGWLLLERPVQPPQRMSKLDEPLLLQASPSTWAAQTVEQWDPEQARAALTDALSRLREQHEVNIERVREQLRQSATFRERSSELRTRISKRRDVVRRP